MTVFYGVTLPPFESNDYVDLDINAEIEYRLGAVGCRLIEIGKQPFVKHALAIEQSIQDREDDDFVRIKLPIEPFYAVDAFDASSWNDDLEQGLRLLGMEKLNLKAGYYLC